MWTQAVLEASGVAALGGAGFLAGRWFSTLRTPIWTIGYFVPLVLIAILWLGRCHEFELVRPMCWLLAGRTEFALAAPIITLVLSTPLSRIHRPQTQRLVLLFMVLLMMLSAVWPFLAPAVNRAQLQGLETRMDKDGVCLQGTDYTCGPAAAVTVLRRLGLPAEESELAMLARTSSGCGTPPDLLVEALRRRYGGELVCEYRYFSSLSELAEYGPTIVLMKYGMFVDHYVVVLKVTTEEVIVGDPLVGSKQLHPHEFLQLWRRSGIVVSDRRTPARAIPISLRTQSASLNPSGTVPSPVASPPSTQLRLNRATVPPPSGPPSN